MKSKPASNTPALIILLIGLVLAAVNMRSPLVMIGSIASTLQERLGLTASDIGYLGALPMPLFAVGSLFAPVLARRFGLEKMMIGMTLLLAIGVATRVWFGVMALYIGTLILSFAIGMLNALTAPFIKQYAPNNIALATAIFSLSMSTMAGIGAWVVLPIATSTSWQMAMSFWGIFGLAAALVWLYVYRTHHSPRQNPPITNHQKFNAWRSASAWQMAVLLGLQSFLFYAAASFLPSIATWSGLSTSDANFSAFLFQIMAPLAILSLTILIKQGCPTRLIGVTGCAFNALGIFGIIYLPTYLPYWSAMMGFGCAMVFTLSLMMFSFRTQNTDHARDLSGMVQAVGYSLAVSGPLGVGLLFEYTGDWQVALWLLAALMLINLPFGYLATSDKQID
ncbi:CynX/NimT family MFS transporter [Moraxella sp.]|uniref:MFS transporter n=1 Tax=Moraxella sp. TaxID=479 RepID=UPI0026DBA0E5|nr:MFS transporter [Moraxella sp.]MDO4894840.1 MFS transporter [Moraxella sp.]